MDDLIKEFDKVMEAYNEEFTATDDPNLQEAINVKYEKLITEAESVLEKGMEAQFEKEQKELEKEQKESEIAIEEKEEPIEDSRTAEYFAKKYKSTDIKTLAKNLELSHKGKEVDVAKLILTKISAEEFEKLLNKTT